MSKLKITPGPWRIVRGTGSRIVGGPKSRVIANAGHEGTQIASGVVLNEDAANAYLIAAAPDLLAAVKDLVRCLRDGQLGDYSALMDEIFDAEHAIAKAEHDERYLREVGE